MCVSVCMHDIVCCILYDYVLNSSVMHGKMKNNKGFTFSEGGKGCQNPYRGMQYSPVNCHHA